MKNNYSIAQRNAIVEDHLWCIDSIIQKNRPLMRAARLEYDDVYQQLAIRLIKAVAGYDPDKGNLQQHIFAQLKYELLNCKAAFRLCGMTGAPRGFQKSDNMVMDDAVDVRECCRKAEELFELYQSCANRKQIETICTNFLRGIEATKLSITGHMYFVPRTYMERVDIFEDFITLLSGLNKKQTPLVVNSFYIIDDAKQRDKMTEEFYLAVKKEIATYQEKCDYLIKSGSQSPAVMDRWVLKVQALEQKKRHYEGVLQRELDGLDDEFSVLKFLSQELQVRANSIRSQRFPTKKAA